MITSLPVFSLRNPRRYKHKCPMRSAPAFGILSQPLPGTTQPAYRYRSRHQEADRMVTNWKDDATAYPAGLRRRAYQPTKPAHAPLPPIARSESKSGGFIS